MIKIRIEKVRIVDDLVTYPKNQRKQISRIYSIINEVFPPALSQSLIEKIQKELKK